ncbi:MAG: DUF2808 domain-containing protein [Iphinoe sp. HA4291-MV1]|jgi:hypothetical protein|nr:DUF2808 domain-containing protein [Iphinoe sp. HA4291-MV1]
MKKPLLYVATFALAIVVSIPTQYASAKQNDGSVTHIDGNVQFPPTRWRLVRHTFRVHVPKNSKAVSQLSIDVPTTVTWSNDINDINVADDKGQKINTNIFVSDRTIVLAFSEPVAPNTQLEIDIKNVKRPTLGNGPVYSFYEKFVGSDAEIPIGVARFRIY